MLLYVPLHLNMYERIRPEQFSILTNILSFSDIRLQNEYLASTMETKYI